MKANTSISCTLSGNLNNRRCLLFNTIHITENLLYDLSTQTLGNALIAPIAMEDGLRFAIREGGRTVGAGVVAKIIE